MSVIVEATNIAKRFGKVEALAGLDVVMESGRVLALLGPNGAGKTTFVRSVATLVRPDAGDLRVAGLDVLRQPAAVRRAIGFAGQYAAVEQALTGFENLQMVGRLFGLDRRGASAAAMNVLRQLGLNDEAGRLVRTYSGGMRRRLDLGASLVGSPRLLLLDEPTTGLDPRSRIELWNAIRTLVRQGTDVLLTTQYLDEADQLADDIVIIDHGRVIASGTPHELKAQIGRDVVDVHVRHPFDLTAVAAALGDIGDELHVDAAAHRVSVTVGDGTGHLMQAAAALAAIDIRVDDIALRRPTLDEVFLSLTGRHAGTDQADDQPDGHVRAREDPR